jgi:phage tail-like protein
MPVINSEIKEKPASHYLEYLPGIYRDNKFMWQFLHIDDTEQHLKIIDIGQYLNIFEDIMRPLENTVDNLSLYFDPMITPESFIPWLASWLDLVPDPSWTIKKRRELIKSAAILHRLRGTKRGLSEYLRIYTGVAPEITEAVQGMTLDSETKLGINTVLGSPGSANSFTVTLEIDGNSEVDIETVKAIIDSQKPAHTVYTLQIKHEENK